MKHHEELCASLETQALQMLGNPDERHTELSRSFELSPHYNVGVRLSDAAGALAGTALASKDSAHYLYVFQNSYTPTTPPESGTNPFGLRHQCTRQVLFSLIYDRDQEGSAYVGGLSYDLPKDLLALLDTFPPKGEDDLALLALTHHLSQMMPENGSYQLTQGECSKASIPVENFLELSSKFAASGTYMQSSYLWRHNEQDDRHTFLRQAVIRPRSAPDMIPDELKKYPLSLQVVQNSIEYTYTRDQAGEREVKVRLTDETMRYADLVSFQANYTEDNTTPLGWPYDLSGVEAIEPGERQQGLYVPTEDNLKIFFEALERPGDPVPPLED